jgi:hypothetical protein
VYNLNIEQAHTYYVGEKTPVLVHNAGCGGRKGLFQLLGVNDFINFKTIIAQLPDDVVSGLALVSKQKAIAFLNTLQNDAALLTEFKAYAAVDADFVAHFSRNPDYIQFWKGMKGKAIAGKFYRYPNAEAAVAALPAAKRTEFFEDFKNAADDVLDGLNRESDLVGIWRDVAFVAAPHRSDILFLRKIKELSGQYADVHVFNGHPLINSTGTIVDIRGVHHHNALTSKTSGFVAGDIRIRPGTQTPPSGTGIYSGLVEIYDGQRWVSKSANNGISSFFPSNWNKQHALEEMAFATSRTPAQKYIGPNSGFNEFTSMSSTGAIQLNYYQGTNKVISVFPK